jgi:hypothetical protein
MANIPLWHAHAKWSSVQSPSFWWWCLNTRFDLDKSYRVNGEYLERHWWGERERDIGGEREKQMHRL